MKRRGTERELRSLRRPGDRGGASLPHAGRTAARRRRGEEQRFRGHLQLPTAQARAMPPMVTSGWRGGPLFTSNTGDGTAAAAAVRRPKCCCSSCGAQRGDNHPTVRSTLSVEGSPQAEHRHRTATLRSTVSSQQTACAPWPGHRHSLLPSASRRPRPRALNGGRHARRRHRPSARLRGRVASEQRKTRRPTLTNLTPTERKLQKGA